MHVGPLKTWVDKTTPTMIRSCLAALSFSYLGKAQATSVHSFIFSLTFNLLVPTVLYHLLHVISCNFPFLFFVLTYFHMLYTKTSHPNFTNQSRTDYVWFDLI